VDFSGANLSEVIFLDAAAIRVNVDEKTNTKNMILVNEDDMKDDDKISDALDAIDEGLRKIILRDNDDFKRVYSSKHVNEIATE